MSRNERAFSLIEMMVATVVTALISLGIVSVVRSGTTAMRTNGSLLDAYTRAMRPLEKVERLLRGASVSSLETLPPGFTTPQPLAEDTVVANVFFRRMLGNAASPLALPSLGNASRVYLQASPSDPLNGVDDDNNGIIDGQHLFLDRPGSPPERLASEVTALSFRLHERELRLSVSIAMRRPDGGVWTVMDTRTVEIRND